ncbi:MAG: hypothetical protein ACK4RK_10860 [Gemmataceae bacterium]
MTWNETSRPARRGQAPPLDRGDSQRIGLERTRNYYREYAALRRRTLDELRQANPTVPPDELLRGTLADEEMTGNGLRTVGQPARPPLRPSKHIVS